MTTWISDPSRGSEGDGIQVRTHSSIDWIASIRGRISYARDNRWMAFSTGCVAFAKERQWRDQYISLAKSAKETDLSFIESASSKRTGFTFDGGAEYAINDQRSMVSEG